VAAQGAKASTSPEIIAQAKPAVIQVIAFDQQWKPIKNGTGFFISPDGYAVTNFHVVSGAANVMARSNNGAFFHYEGLVAHPSDVDLVILKFSATDVPFLHLGQSKDAREGERVLVIGNPEGLQGTVSDGIIAAFRANRSIIQITAAISPGSSGSPVLDENGQLIGVATIQYAEGQNLNFAIAVEWVTAALQQQPQPQPTQGQNAGPALSLSEFVKRFVESGNAADPGIEISFYADSVDYFGDGTVTKAFIAQDIEKYDQSWPRRNYSMDGEPQISIEDSKHDIAKAVVKLQFTVGNVQKTIWGSCENIIFIRDANTNPKVTSVKSRILSRQVVKLQ
jgi:hypothetical protein